MIANDNNKNREVKIMEDKTIVNSIMEAVKKYDAEIDDKIEGIATKYKAEEKRLNNVIKGLQEQLKTKYDSDFHVLVERHLFDELEEALEGANNCLEDARGSVDYITDGYVYDIEGNCDSAKNDIDCGADSVEEALNVMNKMTRPSPKKVIKEPVKK